MCCVCLFSADHQIVFSPFTYASLILYRLHRIYIGIVEKRGLAKGPAWRNVIICLNKKVNNNQVVLFTPTSEDQNARIEHFVQLS